MRFVSALVFTLLIAAQAAPAQEWAQRRLESSLLKHEWTSVHRSGRDIQAFISSPKSDQKVTTVIFLHGDLGLTDWIRSLTDKVA
ncbi:MAG TPA: hypothetical protein VK968_18140, partial [Roseimicrobium sp.]|nr:hypothetical protein [Roseimicrobium sp.]